MKQQKEKTVESVGVKSFITAIVVIFAMMVLTYALTFMIPGGGIPFWKWALSPILVLFGEDSGSMIAIIVLLLVLGGVFNCLDKYGVLRVLLDKITEEETMLEAEADKHWEEQLKDQDSDDKEELIL